ncbi:TPA: phage protein NinX family protein [Enterobacter roggenkampii]
MDYSQLSDQEINVQVARIIHPEREVIESKSRPPSACVIGHLPSKWLDYCNNPADAWPIIVENKIGLTPPMHDENWEAMTFDKFGYVNKNEYNANPLRAAMIVFLLMKEKK